jgi:threonine dehydrogenase-like Zn-dependent dehydrogenase
MGQMHIERALRMPGGPRTIIGVDPNAERLAQAEERLRPTATENGKRLVMSTGTDLPGLVRAESGGRGVDDVIVTAPTVDAVRAADAVMASNGMLVLFAGLPVGTRASVALSRVFLHGAQYTGTSGSRIADQERVIRKTADGQLAPGRAVAAVGGMEAAPDGLRALMENRYPGKIVIFPQLHGLPLTSLSDLATHDSELSAALGEGHTWTKAAEAVLFARYLARDTVSPR